jgi:hypothetical protein
MSEQRLFKTAKLEGVFCTENKPSFTVLINFGEFCEEV